MHRSNTRFVRLSNVQSVFSPSMDWTSSPQAPQYLSCGGIARSLPLTAHLSTEVAHQLSSKLPPRLSALAAALNLPGLRKQEDKDRRLDEQTSGEGGGVDEQSLRIPVAKWHVLPPSRHGVLRNDRLELRDPMAVIGHRRAAFSFWAGQSFAWRVRHKTCVARPLRL